MKRLFGLNRLFHHLESFFTTWRFPSFMLITLFLFWVLIMIMAWMPTGDSAWGTFAEDFKIWCFGYDPATGNMKSIYLIMYTVNPVILAIVIGFVWMEPLSEMFARPAMALNNLALSVAVVLFVGLSFIWMYEFPAEEDFAFRPDVLRTSYDLPEIILTDEQEQSVNLHDYQGKVVLLTSVYASCSDTCPMILDQAKRVLDALVPEEREEVVLTAITMHPEKDTPDLLRRISGFYRLDQYNSHLLTGDPEHVHSILDQLGIARFENAESGVIDHVNLFLLIDKNGEIAFRFTLGETQERWMTEALQLLIREEIPTNIAEVYEQEEVSGR